MSLSSWPQECPKCKSKDFHEIGRIEAGEFTPADPPTDRAIYQCGNCRHEWEH